MVHTLEALQREVGSERSSSPAATGLIQTVEGKRSSRLATISRVKESTDGMVIISDS